MDVALVKSCQNYSDSLTRVLQRWLDLQKKGGEPMLGSCTTATSQLNNSQVDNIHQQSGHLGVKRTLYFARILDPMMSKKIIELVVRACEAWQSIDLAPVSCKKGDLSMKKNWSRLAMDVTDHDGGHFLTLIDWWPLQWQDSTSVICQLETIFYDLPPKY